METGINYDDYVLYVDDLSLEYTVGQKRVYALSHITFGIRENESIGIVGESGCGKSTLAMAISHILPQNTVVTSGKVYFRGEVIVDSSRGASFTLRSSRKADKIEESLKMVRWKGISIVFQGALDSLNPLFTVGEQMSDIFVYRENMEKPMAEEKAKELLKSVGLDEWVYGAFPHQLSGGMKQRVIIAMAISLHPSLVIADEPTTSLDVITQYRIIEELRKLRDKYSVSIMSISHDVAMVSNLSDRIMVMYAGRIVEKLPGIDFSKAQHPYTNLLVNSIPKITEDIAHLEPITGAPPGLTEKIIGCPFYERCNFSAEICREEGSEILKRLSGSHEVACAVLPYRDNTAKLREKPADPIRIVKAVRQNPVIVTRALSKSFSKRVGLRIRDRGKSNIVNAVVDANIVVNQGESVALVGETGSGKTTISRMIGLLEPPSGGKVTIMGIDVDYSNRKQIHDLRKSVQTIFQDPFQSINPRYTIFRAIAEPVLINKLAENYKELEEKVRNAMEAAELTPVEDYLYKYPHQLSGGQRQRVSIARALVVDPKILIADEPISMLDVSLRAGILNLLKKLRDEKGVTLFYITHDIASARYISDRIYVMYKGDIVESGTTEEIIKNPTHPYTMALVLSSIGVRGNVSETLGENIFNQDQGDALPPCKFATRCFLAEEVCFQKAPENAETGIGHHVRCHFAPQLGSLMKNNTAAYGINMEKIRKELRNSP